MPIEESTVLYQVGRGNTKPIAPTIPRQKFISRVDYRFPLAIGVEPGETGRLTHIHYCGSMPPDLDPLYGTLSISPGDAHKN
jgi:hypothetical protein